MASSFSFSFLMFLLLLLSPLALGHQTERERRGGRRVLLGFKETPSGGNLTFECSPSGPCVPCLYSEKNDEKYRCSETSYRIPLKCVEIEAGSNEAKSKKAQRSLSTLENDNAESKHVMLNDSKELSPSIRQRSLLADSSTKVGEPQAYITYRSCIPGANEEKLSILGFEAIILGLLLISGSVVYFKRKQSSTASGAGAMRIPRF